MKSVLFVNATIGFSENLFLVYECDCVKYVSNMYRKHTIMRMTRLFESCDAAYKKKCKICFTIISGKQSESVLLHKIINFPFNHFFSNI